MREFARMLIKDSCGQVLLVKNANFNSWTAPGGKLEPHEAPLTAAIRETREEIGITITDAIHLSTEDFIFGDTPWRGHFYLATAAHGTPTIQEPQKIQAIHYWQPTDELPIQPLIQKLLSHPQLIHTPTNWII